MFKYIDENTMFSDFKFKIGKFYWMRNGGEKMDLETVKNMLGWNSPIGVGIFFVSSGLTVYFLTLALQNIVNL